MRGSPPDVAQSAEFRTLFFPRCELRLTILWRRCGAYADHGVLAVGHGTEFGTRRSWRAVVYRTRLRGTRLLSQLGILQRGGWLPVCCIRRIVGEM